LEVQKSQSEIIEGFFNVKCYVCEKKHDIDLMMQEIINKQLKRCGNKIKKIEDEN